MVWPSLEGGMPTIDLANVADRAMSTSSATAMWGGVGLVGLGFLVRVLGEFVKHSLDEGHTPRYLRELLVLVGFVALMASYKPVALGTVRVVSRLGSDMGSVTSLEKTFSTRMARFGAYVNALDQGAGWRGNFTIDGILARVFQLATILVYIGVQCVMFIIKAVQLFALAAIITYGPVLIGVSTLGGIFSSLGIAWFWALVEVSAWSFTVDILLHIFSGFGSTIPEQFSYVHEIIMAVTLMALLVATIPLTASMVRGHGASALVQSASYMAGKALGAGALGVGAAGVLARPAGGMTRMAGRAASAAGQAVGGAMRRSASSPRAQDAAEGSEPTGSAPEAPWMGEKVRARQEGARPTTPDSEAPPGPTR